MSAKKLSDDLLKKYEEWLRKEKEETLKIISDINSYQKKDSYENTAYSIHQADNGSDTDYSERQAYLLEKENEKLKKLNEALKRVYDKSYGICHICGCQIPEGRLKIVPYAKLCIECKSEEELKEKQTQMRKYITYSIPLFIIIADQITKFLTRFYFAKPDSPYFVKVIGELVRFTHVENRGAAFGMKLQNETVNRVILSTITVIAVFLIIYFIRKAENKLQLVSFLMIFGGAVGNLIDRLFRGTVTDFVDCDFPNAIANLWGATRFPVFNVADSAISIAFVLLIIDQLFLNKHKVSSEDE